MAEFEFRLKGLNEGELQQDEAGHLRLGPSLGVDGVRLAGSRISFVGWLLIIACVVVIYSNIQARRSYISLDSFNPRTTNSSSAQIFGSNRLIPNSLKGDIYYLPIGTNQLPDFNKLSPVATIYTQNLNITPRPFSEGFPGVTNRAEWFAINYSGKFYVGPGTYRFKLTSDDGAKLFIDAQLVLDNDGTHGPTTKEILLPLARGEHSIGVQYFQGPALYIALVLEISPE